MNSEYCLGIPPCSCRKSPLPLSEMTVVYLLCLLSSYSPLSIPFPLQLLLMEQIIKIEVFLMDRSSASHHLTHISVYLYIGSSSSPTKRHLCSFKAHPFTVNAILAFVLNDFSPWITAFCISHHIQLYWLIS